MTNFFDGPIFNFINRVIGNPFFDFLMPILTVIGSGEFIFIISILLFFSKKKETKALGVLLIAGLTISFYATSTLKVIIARPRPFLVIPGAIQHIVENSFSFPSNHAASSFMAALLLSNRFRHYIVFYLLASLVCISRIYLGVHYPTDVLGGAIIGTAIGYFLVYALSTLNSKQ